MPELRFAIRWPDGVRETCYSPSTIIRNHFQANTEYRLPDFVTRCRNALTAASDRVRAVRGSPCSLALGQLARLEATACHFPSASQVLFESFEE
jgi:uncharacterized repeat protein (TIGR04042 family)